MIDEHLDAVHKLSVFMLKRIMIDNSTNFEALAKDIGSMYTGEISLEIVDDAMKVITESIIKMKDVNNAVILKNLGYTIH